MSKIPNAIAQQGAAFTAEARMKAKLDAMTVPELKAAIEALFASDEDGSILAMTEALGNLEHRIPEAEFVAFCDSVHA